MGALVASGELLAIAFQYDAPWDVAALKVIVEEAGGKVTDLYGEDQRYDQRTRGILASNGVLHDELVKMIGL